MATPPELLVIVLDVNASMGAPQPDGRPTYLESAVKAIDLIVQNKILHTKKDEVALVLFGTDGTKNTLAEQDQYQHVTVAWDMSLPNLQLLRYIENSIVPSKRNKGDFVDALVVGMDILSNAATAKTEQRLILFTDAASPFQDPGETLGGIIEGFKAKDIALQVVGIGFGEEEEEDGEDHAHKLTEHTARQLEGIQLLRNIVKETDGQLFSCDSALQMVSRFRKHQVKQVTVFRGCLEIADLKIPLWGYSRQRRATAPTFKKLSTVVDYNPADPESGKVDRRVTYHLADDEDTEITKVDMAKGYKFGRSYVPWQQEDEENMKLKTDKQLALICFTDASKIPRHHYMGGSVVSFAPPPGDEAAAIALAGLCETLYERDKVAVVRYVFRTNAAPKIGILFPHVKSDYVTLLFVQIPYREDIRQLQFPSLRGKRAGATPEQATAMDAFIEKMYLMTAFEDEDGSPVEAVQPKMTFNPVIQHIYQCVHHRAMNPDAPVPELDEMIAKYVRIPEKLKERAAPEIAALKAQFTVVAKADPRTKGTAARLWAQGDAAADAEQERKRARLLEDGEDLSVASMLRAEVSAVGSVSPVEDYLALITSRKEDLLVEASRQLMRRINDVVDVYIGGSLGAFIPMVGVLRKHLAPDEPNLFNDFFQALCTTLRQQPAQRKPFLDELIARGITLISSAENPDSAVTPDEAAAFLQSPQVSAPAPAAAAPVENDDLLDEL